MALRSEGQCTGVSGVLPGPLLLPKWGMHPDPRRQSRHSRGERDVLAGGAGQNMIPFSFPACGRGNSARLALPGEGRWTERLVGPFGFLRAAARTCWVCPAGRVGWAVECVRPCGFCGLPPGPAGFALPGESVGWWGCGALWVLRAAARTCLPCRASRLGGGAVRPCGFCGLVPGRNCGPGKGPKDCALRRRE